MSRGRARAFVAAAGAACLAVATLSLIDIGGPETSRRTLRDEIRLDHIREIARALRCQARAAPGTEPAEAAGIAPACLASDRAAELADPASRAPYSIDRPGPGVARICAAFEAPERLRFYDAPDAPFDRASGCVTVALAP